MISKILRGLLTFLLAVLAIAAVVIGVLMLLAQPMPEHPFFAQFDGRGVIVLAHQGGDGERPSNTMDAFQYAVDLGADVLELDIHSSSDGVLVVIHDATVDRTTDGSGAVKELTFAELTALDAAYDWPTLEGLDTAEYPYRGQGIQIPALEEVFTAFPDMPVSVEIKQTEPSIAQALCDMIRSFDRVNRTIVGSFHPGAMQEFRDACPEVATAGVEPEVRAYYVWNLLGLSPAWQPTTNSFMVPEYSGGLHVLTQTFVKNTRQHNVAVYPWTINTPEDMQRMIDLGVDGIITDYPALLMNLLGRE